MASRRRKGERIDGVLLLDKPTGITSSAALQKSRRLLGADRAGHTGTLDPMASGLLVLCFGEGTKFSGEMLEADKHYVARARLGERTSTGDAEGELLERRPVAVTRKRFEEALDAFRGRITQIPPMYSALKRDGRPLYDFARRGITVDRAPRTVTISALAIENFAGEEATLTVSCSKGTYIRTLVEDIGEALGCGAHLAGLQRTGVAGFRLENAQRLEHFEALDHAERTALLLPIDALVTHLRTLRMEQDQQAAFQHGRPVHVSAGVVDCSGACERVRVYDTDGGFLGVALVDGSGLAHPKRLVVRP